MFEHLLERDAERTALVDRLERLTGDGEGAAVLIEGPPGIGKSASKGCPSC